MSLFVAKEMLDEQEYFIVVELDVSAGLLRRTTSPLNEADMQAFLVEHGGLTEDGARGEIAHARLAWANRNRFR